MKTMSIISKKYKLNLELEENELASLYFAIACTRNKITDYIRQGIKLEGETLHLALLDKLWNARLTIAE
jgi:hypothetical protein